MSHYFRDLGVIERPTQQQVLYATGETELASNEELHSVHFGEDGPGLEVQRTRSFGLIEQEFLSGDLQPWAMDEAMDALFGG